MPKILVFTGGGLAPALNPTIYGVVKSAHNKGWQVLGGLYGWASLLPNDHQVSLDDVDIEPLKQRGGTILRSSRTNPFNLEDGVSIVKEKIKKLNLDGIIAIGGDDTLGAAKKLAEAGLPIVGIPKTVDNDLSGTYFTPGFPSAAHYLADFCRQIKEDAAYALSRIFVIESPGMHAGWLACSAIYGQADVILPPEWEISVDKTLELISECYEKNGNYALVVVGQEVKFDKAIEVGQDKQVGEQFGHQRQEYIAMGLRKYIKEKLNIDTKALYPGNYMESDDPTDLDRNMAIALGEKAVELLKQKQYGQMACIIRKNENISDLDIDNISLQEVVGYKKYKTLPEKYFNKEKLLPTQQFLDYMEPILGKWQEKDDDYTKLIQQLKNK